MAYTAVDRTFMNRCAIPSGRKAAILFAGEDLSVTPTVLPEGSSTYLKEQGLKAGDLETIHASPDPFGAAWRRYIKNDNGVGRGEATDLVVEHASIRRQATVNEAPPGQFCPCRHDVGRLIGSARIGKRKARFSRGFRKSGLAGRWYGAYILDLSELLRKEPCAFIGARLGDSTGCTMDGRLPALIAVRRRGTAGREGQNRA